MNVDMSEKTNLSSLGASRGDVFFLPKDGKPWPVYVNRNHGY